MTIICDAKQLGKSSNINGKLVVLKNLSEISILKPGDIVFFSNDFIKTDSFLVTYLCIQKKVIGIIRNGGGTNDHGAIIAKELGINYLRIEKDLSKYDNETIFLLNDLVYNYESKNIIKNNEDKIFNFPNSSIKVKLNLSFLDVIYKYPNIIKYTDGVGFSRFEFILIQILNGLHPNEYIKNYGEKNLVEKIVKLLLPLVDQLQSENKELWIRTDDFTSDDLLVMKGGNLYEESESGSSNGFRGIRRSISRPEIVYPQFKAINELKEKGYNNIKLFPPMTNSIEEYLIWKKIGKDLGLEDSMFGLMVETPRAAIMIEEFLDEINFVVFGTNDLSQFLLAADRNNPKLVNIFNENDAFVKKIICDVIYKCKNKEIETYIGGNAATNISFVKELIDAGLTGVSVIPNYEIISKLKCEFKK